jgi:hypothetical protein
VLIMRLIKSWGKVRLIVATRVLIFDGETGLAMGVVDKNKGENGRIDLGVGVLEFQKGIHLSAF